MYLVLLRLVSGERIPIEGTATREDAEELARNTAHRFGSTTEWPLVGSRCIRPDAVVSVDIERQLDG